jgi:hypothetical protein
MWMDMTGRAKLVCGSLDYGFIPKKNDERRNKDPSHKE